MSSIRKETFINASSQTVWDALRDVGSLHTRLVPGFVTDTRLEPGARIVTFATARVIRELFVDLNETDATPGVGRGRRTVSALQRLRPSVRRRSRSCRFVWIADLLPNELANDVATMMEQGLSVIKRTMEGSAVRA